MANQHILNVLGMDPSLSNWGLAFGHYNTQTKQLKMLRIDIHTTAKTKVKNSKVNIDDLLRARVLSDAAFEAAKQAHVSFVEVPAGSQSARAMASYGICVGILASLRTNFIPFIEVSPLQVKLATIGKKDASKQSIIDRAVDRYPHLEWPTNKHKGKNAITSSKAEHMADAIGAIEAGLLTDEFQQVLAISR